MTDCAPFRLGVTGHQARNGVDWSWTRDALRLVIEDCDAPVEGWSSLAIGADQLFAEVVLAEGGQLATVVPGPWYADCFDGADAQAYAALIERSRTIVLNFPRGEEAFFAAGRRVADSVDRLIAVWDGEAARGRGGTADIVDYALGHGLQVVHLQPITRTITLLGGGLGVVSGRTAR